MTRPELAALPIEERRRLQREAGLITAHSIDRSRNQHKPNKKERPTHMDQQHTQQPNSDQQTRARRTIEDLTGTVENLTRRVERGEPLIATAKRAGVYAAIWAPVGLGVGWGMLRMARRIFTPAG